jgi:hypothetical protein
MDQLLHPISLVSASAVALLFSAIWQGAVLAACVALCLRLFPHLSAAARSIIWMNVFLLLVLLQVLPSFSEHRTASAGLHPSSLLLLFDLRWGLAIAAAWAVLSIWRGVQLILSAIRSRGLAARATPLCTDAALQALLHVRHGHRAELCASTEIERPSVFGFFHPRILLPAGLFEEFAASDIEQIVMHEMEHLRRGDDWTNLLQKVALVLFPLNPVLFWVERQLCAERELACDDRVLHLTGARKAYANCLTRLAGYSMLRRKLSLALGAWEKRSELVRRIHRILQYPENQIAGKRAVVLTVSLILAALVSAATLARSPQLLSFAPLTQPAMQAPPSLTSGLQESNFQKLDGSPELVKAVMPQKRLQIPQGLAHHHSVAAKRNTRQPQPLPTQPDWVVLTEWEDSAPPARVVITVYQDQRNSYAAVAFANGWLIVQI